MGSIVKKSGCVNMSPTVGPPICNPLISAHSLAISSFEVAASVWRKSFINSAKGSIGQEVKGNAIKVDRRRM